MRKLLKEAVVSRRAVLKAGGATIAGALFCAERHTPRQRVRSRSCF